MAIMADSFVIGRPSKICVENNVAQSNLLAIEKLTSRYRKSNISVTAQPQDL
jgi:hypothetical protein